MTSTPSPTWYDVLGVSRTASPYQIKAAWRLATDKFEPGTGAGQFRMFNEAADVLPVLAIAAIVVAVLIGLKVRTDNQVADARQQAPAAAEQAAKAIFAYD